MKVCRRCFHSFFCAAKCHRKGWIVHKYFCYPIERSQYKNRANIALHEGLTHDLFHEYQTLVTFARESSDIEEDFDKGRRLTFQAIIAMIELDPVGGDPGDHPEIKEMLREGGHLLNKNGGITSMRDSLVFSFIPRRYHGVLNHVWDNIGDWRS